MKNLLIIILGLTFFLFCTGWLLFAPPKTETVIMPGHTPQGITDEISTKAFQNHTQSIRVLFIGNSYTFFFDLPGMIVNIADSDPDNKVQITVQTISGGGLRLMDHWEKGNARRILKKKPWDYVVLQNNSMWAMYKDLREETQIYLPRFVNEARKAGVKPIFVKTWVRQPGSLWYEDRKHKSVLISPEHMYDTFNKETNAIAQKLKLDVMPLVDYWMFIHQEHPALNLYASDGTHPYVTGTYLNALLFYRYFTGNSLKNITYIPGGIKKEDAITLQEIAAYGQK